MGVNYDFVGTSMEPFIVEVEKGAIRAFARATAAPSLLHYDESFALSQGFSGLVAPLTFPTSFRPDKRQPWMEGLDEGRILAGEQYFKYQRPIVAGDILTCEFKLVRIDEKQGKSGLLQFLVQELEAVDQNGQQVVVNGRVTIYRSPGKLGS